jgi:hypothetical protein
MRLALIALFLAGCGTDSGGGGVVFCQDATPNQICLPLQGEGGYLSLCRGSQDRQSVCNNNYVRVTIWGSIDAQIKTWSITDINGREVGYYQQTTSNGRLVKCKQWGTIPPQCIY